MVQIVKERMREKAIGYSLDFFRDDGGCCFSFPCDKNGNVFTLEHDAAKKNFEYCMTHKDEFELGGYVEKHETILINPAVARCECGAEFSLVEQLCGACECPNCGKWYNLFGQELKSPENWYGEDFDDDFWEE